ncbi:MAG: SseB family protein [Erysipelotrichaceae bacterium]|nr:SseB family protein [Erysipelotrichaceae bacterium]
MKNKWKDVDMLETVITRFVNDRTQQNYFDLLDVLKDSYIWVPCTAVMSEADQRRFMELLDNNDDITGLEFVAQDETRLIPDILQSGDDYFFPIFSSVEAMGEYGENFSHIERSFMEAINLARNNNKKPVAIVLNAFTNPIEISMELCNIVEKMVLENNLN